MGAPIAIIAGNGALPLEVAHSLLAKGESVFICAIKGEASQEIEQFPHVYLSWGQIGKLFKSLKAEKVERVVMAGGVMARPDFKLTQMDWGTMRTLPALLGKLLAGDNELLTGVIEIFENRGFQVCSVAQLVPQLLVIAGNNGAVKAKGSDLKLVETGRAVCGSLSPHDVGQACVVLGKRAIAIEGVEGTAEMLQRVADLRARGRLPERRSGVLVKVPKLGQDERADLPTIGPDTIDQIQAAGLVGIGLQAGSSLMLHRGETIGRANTRKIFIHGVEAKT